MMFNAEAIKRAVRLEDENSKSMNPFQHVVIFRDGLRNNFGTDSSLFINTTEGIVYALTRFVYETGGHLPPDLFEIQKLLFEKMKTYPLEEVYQFAHGYVLGLSYLHAVWDDLEEGEEDEKAQRAARLLHMFQSPTGTLY